MPVLSQKTAPRVTKTSNITTSMVLVPCYSRSKTAISQRYRIGLLLTRHTHRIWLNSASHYIGLLIWRAMYGRRCLLKAHTATSAFPHWLSDQNFHNPLRPPFQAGYTVATAVRGIVRVFEIG